MQEIFLGIAVLPLVVAQNASTVLPKFSDAIQLVSVDWDKTETPYMISLWLLVAALAKILFNGFKRLSQICPDSSLLIAVGLLLGAVLRFCTSGTGFNYSLDSHVFFLYLLPPIIFDAGYFMPNRALFENIDSVLLFSVVGTIWNTLAIGGSLLGLSYLDLFAIDFSVFEIFVFSALISAVDPVAVIAIFEEIHVNEFLFVNVFGEALFNDAVTVVLYKTFESFAVTGAENIKPRDYVEGGMMFFVVSLGGTAIGIAFAFITALVTKYTNSVKILAPVFIFILPYMSYLTAEMTSLSAILAISVCGMFMKQYVKGNISAAATHSVKYFTKMLAQSSETVIFMFLGLSTLSGNIQHCFDVYFIIATIFFCLLFRVIGVLTQCWILNKFRKKKFTAVDQFILSFGGLRGAIAFGLVVSMSNHIAAKPMFVTTTIAVIFFTVFLQGMAIRPLVKYLRVETKEHRRTTMAESVYNKYIDYMMSGLEDIAGQHGQHSIRDGFERFNAKTLKPFLMRNEQKSHFDASCIVRAYAKITLEDAMNLTKRTKHKLEHKSLAQLKNESNVAGAYTNDGYEKESISEQNLHTLTPTDKQLERFLQRGENVESLYRLFSDLLDRKLREINVAPAVEVEECDIEDDYMQQMHSNAGSLLNIRNQSEILTVPRARQERRQSTGGIVEQKKHMV